MCILLKAFLACLKTSEVFESAVRGRLFATEHLKGQYPFDLVIDSGRSDLFLYTVHPFFSLVLHFLRAAHLSVQGLLIVSNTTYIDTDTNSHLQNIGIQCIFLSQSFFLAMKLRRFRVVLLHSILRSVIPCSGPCFQPCLCCCSAQ